MSFKKSASILSLAASASVALFGLGLAAPASANHPPVPAPCETITSSGTIVKPDGNTVTFAATGGCKNGAFWGSLSYSDLGAGIQVSSTDITGYLWDPAQPTMREVCGIGLTQNGEEVMFRARLVDNGEPGRMDTFAIATDNQHTAGERFYIFTPAPLEEGNVNLHKANRSTTIDPSLAGLQEWQMCGDLNSPM